MAPHGIYPCAGEDEWVAIACRGDEDWRGLAGTVGEPWTADGRFAELSGRLAFEDELDGLLAAWTSSREKFAIAADLRGAGVPASAVQKPGERIDHDLGTSAWGLWPTVEHTEMGKVRVDGLPVHLSETDWEITRGGPCLGEHNDYVFGELLGVSSEEMSSLTKEGVL
jgi:benzylsuccinate CoA-transferase BbsF subunit